MVQMNEREVVSAIAALQDKLIQELGNIYDAEHRFLEAQHLMLRQVTSNLVKSMLETHILQTQQQIKNLEQVFSAMEIEPVRINCEAASGLVIDGRKLMAAAATHPAVVDLAIAEVQSKIECFEIACYRAVISTIEQLGNSNIISLLKQNLQQEEQTAQLLEESFPELFEQVRMTADSQF